MSVTSKLGSLLRRLRKEKKLTQLDVAEASGLARVHIAYLETGKRGGGRVGWETMIGLAKAFGVSADEFAKMLADERASKPQPERGRPRKPAPEPAAEAAGPETAKVSKKRKPGPAKGKRNGK